ncbi:MAG: methyl-accepting chemotaxis protein [Burkholderiales bacterium]|nr:methyl-accepting chemotaxis protein [Burkholderiales bacterium]
MRTLSSRLIGFVVVSVAGVALLLTAFSYTRMRDQVLSALDREVDQVAALQAARIAAWLDSKRRLIDTAAKAAASEDEALRAMLLRTRLAGDFSYSYMGFPDKRLVHGDDTPVPAGFDPTIRPWYKMAMERGKVSVTAPFMSVSDHALIVSVAAPVQRNGQFLGVVSANVVLEKMVGSVLGLKLVGDSHAFLVSKDGVVIGHRQADAALGSVSKLIAGLTADSLAALATQSRSAEVAYADGTPYLLTVRAIPDSDWLVAVMVDRNAALAPLRELLITLMAAALIAIAVAAGLGVFASRALLGGLRSLRDAMADISGGEGDLTVRLEVRGEDEVGQAAGAFNQFLQRLHGMFQDVQARAHQVTGDVARAAQTTTEVSRNVARQSEDLGATAASIEEVTVSITHIADVVKDAESVLASADVRSSESVESVERVKQEIARVAGTMGQLSTVVDRLGSRSKEISGIVDAIKDIADQTNLLALNAAIEAARAGEQGRGFALVADEVRKLAERTAQATVEIGHMIEAIRSDMDSAVVGMGTTQQNVFSSVSLVEVASDGIRGIRMQMSDVVSRMKDISSATAEQAAATNEMARRAEQINAVSQASSAALHETESSLRATSALAESLGRSVARFRL